MRTTSRRLSRRAFLATLAAGGAAAGGLAFAASRLTAPGPGTPPRRPPQLDPDLAEDVRAEFLRTYEAYRRLAGDHDELHPLSGSGGDFFAAGHPVRLTTIEALDTLYLMELDQELSEGIEFAADELSFDIDAPFQVFETIIRVVGGLLSAHHASLDDRLLAKARDLADRLMPAFDRSPTGMPYRFVNLRSGEVSEPINVLAEIGTCMTELGELSRLTGDDRYLNAATRAQLAVVERRSALDLVGTQIDVETGEWTDARSTINPPVDSFFEYLFEAGPLLDDAEAGRAFDLLTDAIVRHQSVEIDGRLWFSTVDSRSGDQQSLTQSELAAFYAGLLADSGRVDLGRRYHDSWKAVLDHGFRILPEWLDPTTLEATDPANQLRPRVRGRGIHAVAADRRRTLRGARGRLLPEHEGDEPRRERLHHPA